MILHLISLFCFAFEQEPLPPGVSIQEIIDRLDNEAIEVREKATQTIRDVGLMALPDIRSALKAPLSEEQQARLESILRELKRKFLKVTLSPKTQPTLLETGKMPLIWLPIEWTLENRGDEELTLLKPQPFGTSPYPWQISINGLQGPLHPASEFNPIAGPKDTFTMKPGERSTLNLDWRPRSLCRGFVPGKYRAALRCRFGTGPGPEHVTDWESDWSEEIELEFTLPPEAPKSEATTPRVTLELIAPAGPIHLPRDTEGHFSIDLQCTLHNQSTEELILVDPGSRGIYPNPWQVRVNDWQVPLRNGGCAWSRFDKDMLKTLAPQQTLVTSIDWNYTLANFTGVPGRYRLAVRYEFTKETSRTYGASAEDVTELNTAASNEIEIELVVD